MATDCRLKAMEADRYAVTTLRSWRATDAGALALDLEGATALVAIAEDGSVSLRARADVSEREKEILLAGGKLNVIRHGGGSENRTA